MQKSAQYSSPSNQTRFGPPGPLWGPLGQPGENDQASVHLGAKGFQIMKIGPGVSKVCPWQIWSHWTFILGPRGLRVPYFYTFLNVVPISFKKSFLWIQWKFFCKIDENLNFDLFWSYPGSKRLKTNTPPGPIFYTFLSHSKSVGQ